MKTKLLGVVAVLALLGPASAATTTYTDSAAYFAAVGPLSLQDFNSPISSTDTSITYPNLVISCSGSTICNSTFFGTRADISIDGLSIFHSTPSVVTFTFNSPITSFGIYIGGLGTIGSGTSFSISNSNGFSVLFPNYSGTTNDFNLFAGLVSDARFTSVSLMGTQREGFGDGIFMDNLYIGHSAVPLPAALPLFATGLGALGLLGWRGKRKQPA